MQDQALPSDGSPTLADASDGFAADTLRVDVLQPDALQPDALQPDALQPDALQGDAAFVCAAETNAVRCVFEGTTSGNETCTATPVTSSQVGREVSCRNGGAGYCELSLCGAIGDRFEIVGCGTTDKLGRTSQSIVVGGGAYFYFECASHTDASVQSDAAVDAGPPAPVEIAQITSATWAGGATTTARSTWLFSAAYFTDPANVDAIYTLRQTSTLVPHGLKYGNTYWLDHGSYLEFSYGQGTLAGPGDLAIVYGAHAVTPATRISILDGGATIVSICLPALNGNAMFADLRRLYVATDGSTYADASLTQLVEACP